MVSLNEVRGYIAVFFKLNMPFHRLISIFEDTIFNISTTPLTREISPGVQVGPLQLKIAEIKDEVVISYTSERFLLRFEGSLSLALEFLEQTEEGLKKFGQILDNTIRFYEIGIREKELLNQDIRILFNEMKLPNTFIEKLNKLYQIDFNPFSLDFSDPFSPMSDNWFRITLRPDNFTPTNIIRLSATKRCTTSDECRSFLTKLVPLIDHLESYFKMSEIT